jgi:hypothetical protein
MIIKKVPYISDKQEKYASCQGQPTVMMIVKFFLPNLGISFKELYKKMEYSAGEWFFEMYIVKLLYELSVPSVYYSTNKIKSCSNERCFRKISGLDFNNKSDRNEFNLDHYNTSIGFVKKYNLFKHVKKIDVEFIKNKIINSKLVIATINRNKFVNKEGYKGHFILIKGFNENSFICNDAYFGEDIIVPFDKFLEAFYYVDWGKPNDKKEYVRDVVVIG